MRKEQKIIVACVFFSICFLFLTAFSAFGAGYEGLEGVKTIKAVFDVRTASPKSGALMIKLIHQTFKDKNIAAITDKPDFVVVFIGPSVKLISKERRGFSPEESKMLDEIAGTISEMSKDGIKLEICLVAARLLGVDPASVLPEIKHVDNGLISLIGWQTNGYALVPVY